MERYALTDQIELVFHLEKAIENDEFVIFFQPIIHTISGSLCGFEALVRWNHPEYGFLNPGAFIAALEDTRQIHHLDTHVIELVCRWYAKERDAGRPIVPVSINFSRLDFEAVDVFSIVEKTIAKYGMPRSMLNIEITESAFSDDDNRMTDVITRFREAGYQVWMDDFGSGYSSLNTLKDHVFDELKIDMAFLSDMSLRSKCIISSMISMAKDIRMVTLVEGVETQEQVEFLRSIGCDRLQGYYFAPPMPYEDLLGVLKEKDIHFETPEDRRYYHEINRINILSSAPFDVGADIADRHGGGIPLAVLEKKGEVLNFLYINEEFRRMLRLIGSSDALSGVQKLVHFGILTEEQIDQFLTKTIEEGERRIDFSVNGDFCSARAKRISQQSGRVAMLLSITNITRDHDIDHEALMNQSLMNLYSMYIRVSIIRPEKDELVTVYSTDHHNVKTDTPHLAHALLRWYAAENVHPDDVQTYLDFVEPATIEERILNSRRGFINVKLRTKDKDGDYSNKMYLAVPMGNREAMLLVRYANL